MSTNWATVKQAVAAVPGECFFWAKRLDTGEVCDLNGTAVVPAASTIKIPVLTTLYRRVEAGEKRLDERITIEPEHRAGGSGVIRDLDPGLQPTIKDLATLMIIISDNSATNRCMDAAGGFAAVTGTMRDLGLQATTLVRYTTGSQPDDPKAPVNETSAHDLARLLEMIWTGQAASRATCDGMLDVLGRQQLKSRLPRYYPDTVKHYGKTGTTGRADEGWACRHDSSLLVTPTGVITCACLTRFKTAETDGWAIDEAIGQVGKAVAGLLG